MKRFLFILLILFAAVTQIFSRSITLRWNPVDDVILNYRIYWGISSGNYTQSRDVGDRTEYKIDSLDDGVAYFFSVTAIDYWGNESDYSNEVFTSGKILLPEIYELAVNYPNPFNSGTSFQFNLPENKNIQIAIYNSVGQEIIVLEQGDFPAGFHRTFWNGLDDTKRPVSSGTYFCVLFAGHLRLTRSITLLR